MPNIQKAIQEKITKNLLDTIILQLLNHHSMCGYEIMATIKKQYGVYLGASTTYPMLNRLEKKKLVKGQWDLKTNRSKKTYHLTTQGEEMLKYTSNSLNHIFKTIENVKTEKDMEIRVMP